MRTKPKSKYVKIAFPEKMYKLIEEEAFEIGFTFQQYVRVLLASHFKVTRREQSKVGDMKLELKTTGPARESEPSLLEPDDGEII